MRAGHGGPEATFTQHWLKSGGSLDLRGHAPLRVRIRRFRRRLVMQTRDGEGVLTLRYRGVVHLRGELRFGQGATKYDASLLSVIAWYLIVTRWFRTGGDWFHPSDI